MGVTLPYRFDTTGAVKGIVGGAMGLLVVVIVPGILYSFFISLSWLAALQLLLIGGVVLYFGRKYLKGLEGSRGTITADAVVVEPSALWGVRLPGPEGRIPIQQLKAVRVEHILASGPEVHQSYERVRLVGKDGAPDILIARTDGDAGRTLGRELAAALGLAYEDGSAPY